MDCVPALEPLFLRYRLRRCARVGVSSTWAAGRNEDEKKMRALRNCWVLRITDIFEQPAEITSEPVCVYDWLPTPSLIYPMLIARVPTSPRASRVDDVPDATVKLRLRLTTRTSLLPTFMTVQLTSSETTQNSQERPLYEGTTQFRNWRYSLEQLREIRSSLNAAAVAVIKNALEVNSARLSFRHCPQCPR